MNRKAVCREPVSAEIKFKPDDWSHEKHYITPRVESYTGSFFTGGSKTSGVIGDHMVLLQEQSDPIWAGTLMERISRCLSPAKIIA